MGIIEQRYLAKGRIWVRVNTGRELSVLTTSVFLTHTDNGLGHKTRPKLSTFKLLNRNLMFYSGSMTIGSSYQTKGAAAAALAAAHMRMLCDGKSV